MGDLCRSFLSSCVAFSRASFESLVFLILSSISASSSLPSSSPSSFWIAFICSWRKNSRWVFSICRLTRVRMRLSTCSTEISLSIRPSSFSSRSVTDVVSRIACRSGILRARCEATVSALVFDLLDDADHLGRHPLVELRVALEVIGDRAREGLGFDALTHRLAQRDRLGLVILAAIRVLDHFGALSALDQDLDGAIGELEQLQHARKRANVVDRLRCRIVVGHVLLGGEQDEGVGPHHLLEREDRLLASDEEGHDHVRKYDGVAQWQHRIGSGFTWRKQW